MGEVFNHPQTAPEQVDAPFSEDLAQQFRASLDSLLPLDQPLDWQVREDQPLCLHALQAISKYMNDPDQIEIFFQL